MITLRALILLITIATPRDSLPPSARATAVAARHQLRADAFEARAAVRRAARHRRVIFREMPHQYRPRLRGWKARPGCEYGERCLLALGRPSANTSTSTSNGEVV